MIFGKIDYINLLPFYVYLRKTRANIVYKKGFPSSINKKFKAREVDAAFISSIEARRCRCLKLGIVAKKEVKSVFVKRGENKIDAHSATSNVLAKVLGLKGEVLIGDKALKQYLANPENLIDLSLEWNKKYNLPFVFALLCTNKKSKQLKKILKKFPQKVYIPQYILNAYSHSRNIPKKEIINYLQLISYNIAQKEKQSLKLFYKKSNYADKW
jgi:chorismate dehydratase